MSSKRVAAREWKRKKKQQQTITRLAVAGACLLVVLVIGYVGWDMWSRTYVMTFEGQRIPTNEMRFLSMLADGQTDPRFQAMENLTYFLLVDQAAKRHNIALTAEEQAEVYHQTVSLMGMFESFGMQVPNISAERAAELMSTEILAERLMDIYTADFEIDETEFSHAFLEFMTFGRMGFIEMDFRMHVSDSMDAALIAWDDLTAAEPEEWDEIILRDAAYGTGIALEDAEVPTVSLAELREELDIGIISNLTTLNVGEFSEPIQVAPETVIIFIADSFEVPSDEELEEIFREHYERQQRMSIFNELVFEWREEANIQINTRGVNAA